MSGWSVSSISAELRAIAVALQWAARSGVDLEQRIGDGSLLTAVEIIALRDALRMNLVTQGTVVPLVFYTRCLHVRDYIEWRAEHSLQKRQGDDPLLGYSRHRLAEFMKNMMEFLPKPQSGTRQGITAEAERRLFEVIRPGHPENPFRAKNQHRNQALILLYCQLGIRLSEALVLKGQDLDLHGPEPGLVVHRRADDPDDTRADPPLVKTASRLLPLSQELRGILLEWVTIHRADRDRYPGAKKIPYVFVSARGTPLGKRSVSAMLNLLAAMPGLEGLSAHPLRHRWNDAFSELCDETNVPEEKEQSMRETLMGWKKGSKMAQTYTQRSTRKAASKASLALQRKNTREGIQ